MLRETLLVITLLFISCTTFTKSFDIANDYLDTVSLPLKVGVPTTSTLRPQQPLELTIQGSLDPSHQFWVFEAHSQYYDLSLSTDAPQIQQEDSSTFSVNSNPGIIVTRDEDNLNLAPKVYLSSKATHNVSVLILVRGYAAEVPVPGLINRNGATTLAPSLNVSWDEHAIRVQFYDAGQLSPNKTLEATSSKKLAEASLIFEYRVFQRFMEEREFDEMSYIDQMSRFLMETDILMTGREVGDTFVRRNSTENLNEVIFGSYPGTAAFFAVIVTTRMTMPNGTEIALSNVYVSSATYGCNLDESLPLNCKVMWLTITKVVCAFSVFIGLFIALVGHRYFQVTQFFFGIFAGYFVGYVLVEKFASFDFSGTLGLAAGIALTFAIIWSFLWFFCGIPLLATLLPTAVLGLLFGCILVFLPPLNITSMTDDTTYWCSIAAFTIGGHGELKYQEMDNHTGPIGTPLVLLSFTQSASIASCAIVGSFAIVTPIDHYIGSSLKYILVNVVRRATVQDFNYAVIYYPFQSNDIALVFGWLGIILVSALVQRFRERNRAPFPPNMYQQWRWRREERNSMSENEANLASETSPLLFSTRPDPLVPAENHAYMSPVRLNAPRANRTPTPGATPVVGYIEGYGSTSALPSPVYRIVQMPEFYERRVASTSLARSATHSSKRTNGTNAHEDSDIFRPPDDN